ncbi:MAG TPA: hypothetical protein VKX16_01270 [Chloroflexota bacterium]|nr:hypothetical protein [Chloroflexota bacterium]
MESASEPPASDGFQPRGRAWSPFRLDVPDLLRSARPISTRPIYHGSNHTFLVTLDAGADGRSFAVYKPVRGESPLYDFPDGTLYRRETAAWLLDALLGWQLVPPTVIARGEYGIGSVQLFIESVNGGEVEVRELQRMALFDTIANNADRKPEHFLLTEAGKVWGIDHGLTFNAQPKLRTVLWHFSGEPIPEPELDDLRSLLRRLETRDSDRATQLSGLLARHEWAALRSRVERLVAAGIFPDPRYKSVPYRW